MNGRHIDWNIQSSKGFELMLGEGWTHVKTRWLRSWCTRVAEIENKIMLCIFEIGLMPKTQACYQRSSEQIPEFLDVLDELLPVLLPLVAVFGHHQLAAVAGLWRRLRRRRRLHLLLLISVSCAPSACTITVVFVSRTLATHLTTCSIALCRVLI